VSLIYLGTPIDQSGDPKHEWQYLERELVTLEMTGSGHDVYLPFAAFSAGTCGPEIQRVNRAALAECAGAVFLLPAGVPTLGCPAEIEQSVSAGTPVLICTDLGRSVQIQDWRSRGAQVCGPGEEMGQGLLWLQRRLVESARGADGRGGGAVAPPLVFEQVDGRWADRTDSPESCLLLPSRGYPGDAGLDLYVSEDTAIPAYAFVDVPCGVRIDIPEGMWAMITGRSSTLRKRGLLVSTGVIDQGWTGPLFAGVQNLLGDEDFVRAGDRLAQLILLPAPAAGFVPTWGTVPAKARGESGFGSTGS
jgi:dUTP pyrophosphatase